MTNKSKIFVIWADYDGEYVKEFNVMNARCYQFMEKIALKHSSKVYGTRLIAVIEGTGFCNAEKKDSI